MAVDDSYTTSLLHFDGADASTTFTDESGKIWSPSVAAQIDTADKKYGGASGLFNSDYITTPDHADWDVGANDFTVEMWVKNPVATGRRLFGQGDSLATTSDSSYAIIVSTDTYNVFVHSGATSYGIFADAPVNTSDWQHLAMVRYNNILKFYVDGVAQSTTQNLTGVTVNNSANAVAIGRRGENNTFPFVGWIDEFRFSKGIARYTANFTPPGPFYPPTGENPYFADGYSVY